MKLLFLTHHKCGSGWFNKINFELFKKYGRVVHVLNDDILKHKNINDYYEEKKIGFLSYNNANINLINLNDDIRAIHVVRDPRDIIVSGYYSHKKVHPIYDTEEGRALEQHREILNNIDLNEGLIKEIEFSKKWYLDKLMGLSMVSSDKILRLKLEDISTNTVEKYQEILTFYGLEVKGTKFNLALEKINQIIVPLSKRNVFLQRKGICQSNICIKSFTKLIEEKSFKNISGGREKGHEDSNSHFRKGVSGDWKTHFSQTHIKLFENSFPGLLERLNY
jgi:hypothetical protein